MSAEIRVLLGENMALSAQNLLVLPWKIPYPLRWVSAVFKLKPYSRLPASILVVVLIFLLSISYGTFLGRVPSFPLHIFFALISPNYLLLFST